MRLAGKLAAALAAVAAAGCGGGDVTGSGTAPEKLIVYAGLSADTVVGVECGSAPFKAQLLFTNDTSANYASRVHWSSSDAAVAAVSNGDLKAEDGSVYSAGTVIYRRPGAATITANYLDDLIDSIGVQVIALDSLAIEPANTRLTPESYYRFTLKGYTATGYPVDDLGTTARWSFLESSAPADILSSGSSVRVTVLDGPLQEAFTLHVSLPECGRSIDRELRIEQPQQLLLTTEQGADHVLPLSVVEGLQVFAGFADGSQQNLSGQVAIEQLAGDDEDASLASQTGDVDKDVLLLAPAVSGTTVGYEFCYDALSLCLQTPLYNLAEVELGSVRVTPSSATLTYPETLDLKAYGDFADEIERDITRAVTWVSDSSAVGVASKSADAGHVSSTDNDGDALITATSAVAADTVDDQSKLKVYSREP